MQCVIEKYVCYVLDSFHYFVAFNVYAICQWIMQMIDNYEESIQVKTRARC